MKTRSAVFLVPRLEAPPGAGFEVPGASAAAVSDLRPNGQRLEWIGKNGRWWMSAQRFLVNPLVENKDGDKSASATSLQSVKTANGRMVEIKACGAVVFTPYLLLVEDGKEVEIRPLGDKLRSSDGKIAETFTSMSFDP